MTQTFLYKKGVITDIRDGFPHITLCETGAIFRFTHTGRMFIVVEVISNGKPLRIFKRYVEDISGWIPSQIWKKPDTPINPSISINWDDSVNWHSDNVLNTPGSVFNRHVIKNFVGRENLTLTVSSMGEASPFLIAGRKPQIETDGFRLEWANNTDYEYIFEFSDNIHIDQLRLRFTSQNDPTGSTIILRTFKSSSVDEAAVWEGDDIPIGDRRTYYRLRPTQTDQIFSLKLEGEAVRSFSFEMEPVNTGEATIVVADWIVRASDVGDFYRVEWNSDTSSYEGRSLNTGETVHLTTQNRLGGWQLKSQAGRSVQRMNQAPTALDDERFGFVAGSTWSTDNTNIYECLRSDAGNALWRLINAQSLNRGVDPVLDVNLATSSGSMPGFYGLIGTDQLLQINKNESTISLARKGGNVDTPDDYLVRLTNEGVLGLNASNISLESIFYDVAPGGVRHRIASYDFVIQPYLEPVTRTNPTRLDLEDALVVDRVVSEESPFSTAGNNGTKDSYRLAFKNVATILVERSVTDHVSSVVPTDVIADPDIAALQVSEISRKLYLTNERGETTWFLSQIQRITNNLYLFQTVPTAKPRLVWDIEAARLYLYRGLPDQTRDQLFPVDAGADVVISADAPAVSDTLPTWKTWRQETATEVRQFIWAAVGPQYHPLPIPWFQRIENNKLTDVYALIKPTYSTPTVSTTPVTDPLDATIVMRTIFIGSTGILGMGGTVVGWPYQLRLNGVWDGEIKMVTRTFQNDFTAGIDGLRLWFPRQDPAVDNPAYESTNIGS